MESIAAYLDRFSLGGFVPIIVGRAYGRPALMKPDPFPLKVATTSLRIASRRCLLLGDSTSDVAAGRLRMSCVGFANGPRKFIELSKAGADLVVGADGMDLLGEALARMSGRPC